MNRKKVVDGAWIDASDKKTAAGVRWRLCEEPNDSDDSDDSSHPRNGIPKSALPGHTPAPRRSGARVCESHQSPESLPAAGTPAMAPASEVPRARTPGGEGGRDEATIAHEHGRASSMETNLQ